MIKDQQDLDLIDRIRGGDSSACKVLVDKHKNYAYTIAFRILGNREEAEEIAQDAFLNALGSLNAFKQDSKFTTWFYRIVHNLAVSQVRKRKVHWDSLEDHRDLQGEEINTSALSMQERRHFLQLAMERLIPEDVTMLTLFYLKEFSLQEISEITQIATGTAKVKLFRARKRLAVELHLVLQNEVNSLL